MHKKNGFTFIEVTVVIAIMVVVLPLIFSILFTMLRQQTRVYRLSQVKREGDFILGVMTDTIRNNAIGIRSKSPSCAASGWSTFLSTAVEQCNDSAGAFPATYTSSLEGADFCFEDRYGKGFHFYLDSGIVSSDSASLTNGAVDLSTSSVVVSDLQIACNRSARFSAPSVNVSFTVTANPNNSTRVEDSATLDYHTTIKLRNF